MRDPEVRLTWVDSPDVSGNYLIYRHTQEINAATFLDAELAGEVEPGVQSFIDTPAAPGDYYYAILASTDTGEPYEIFIAFRNATFVPVTVENIATVEERSARIQDITATEESGVIIVAYESDQVDRELIVYRSTRPLAGVRDLATAGVVATVVSGVESVTDYPVPGVPYYYGVVDSALVADGSAVFEAGENTTGEPVEVPIRTAGAPPIAETPAPAVQTPDAEPETEETPIPAAAESPQPAAPASDAEPGAETGEDQFIPTFTRRRPMPLPFLQLTTDLQTGNQIGTAVVQVPELQPISVETEDAVSRMVAMLGPRPVRVPGPERLPEDNLPAPRGAEFTLRTILDGPFASLGWEEALGQLTNFLTLPLSPDIRARALFYRAQCYYFTGQSERAFVEFLLARNDYFSEVERWLDIILDATGA